MKAINCTQCGATITDVHETSVVVDCDYCGARILLSRDKPEPAPPVPVEPSHLNPIPRPKIFGLAAVIVVLPLIIGAAILFSGTRSSTPARKYAVASTPTSYPTPSSWPAPETTPTRPVPVVNYQPRISWDGPNDLEHFAEPEVDISSVSHLTSEEVKNTVFKNRIVKLKVVINTEGEIDEVEPVSAHPILIDAATASAKQTIFKSRSKPTTRILTYTFRVLKD